MAGLGGAKSASVRLAGDLDQSSIGEARALIASRLTPSTQTIVINMAGVTFFGAAAAGLLIELCEQGLQVELVAVPRQVSRVLEICELEDRFTLH